MSNSNVPLTRGETGWRLRLVVFVSGAVLMGLELAGSRVLAVHFGSSIYVWGAIIGVFLASLSIGYYLGGNIADRWPNFLLLNLLIVIAGAWLLVTPVYANWVCRGIRLLDLGVRLGPLVATLLLFGGPSILMGTVSPFAVRLAARAVESMGNLSGRLYALSTVGSIAGTLLTAFWLVPSVGVRLLLQVLGLCLLLLPAIVLAGSRARLALVAPLAAGALVALWPGGGAPAVPGRQVVHEADSAYHHILVIDDTQEHTRSLQFDSNVEGTIKLSPPYETHFGYSDAFHLARVFRPELRRVLFIGGGAGIGARKFLAEDPGVLVDLVEIDPVVVKASHDYFFLEPDPRLRVYTEDGRNFVRRTKEKYDLVVLDAYTLAAQVPFHLTTREFMEEVKSVLAPEGVVVANIAYALEGPSSRVLRAQYKTFDAVFGKLYMFPLPRDDERAQNRPLDPLRRRNIILIADPGGRVWEKESFVRELATLEHVGAPLKATLAEFAQRFTTVPPRTDDVPVLTDDYAPVDTMF
jgi:spermidine synthase